MPGTLKNPSVINGSSKKIELSADNVLKNKVKSMEEADEARKLARAAERDLQQRLSKELESAKLNALLVQESWRKIMRTIKVSSYYICLSIIKKNHTLTFYFHLLHSLYTSFLPCYRLKSLSMIWKS